MAENRTESRLVLSCATVTRGTLASLFAAPLQLQRIYYPKCLVRPTSVDVRWVDRLLGFA